MKNLLLEDIKKIAVELDITLSYKDEEGKRKRYTKDELIAKIEEVSKLESEQVNVPLHSALEVDILEFDKYNLYPSYSMIYGENTIDNSEFLMKDIVNANPVVTAKQFIKNDKSKELKELIDNLYRLSNDKNEKSIQRSKYSKSLKLIKALLYSKGLAF